MNSVGNRILEMRTALKLSQEKFGELCGLSRPSIMRYETGVNLPSREAVQKIAEACNVSVDWLLHGDEHSDDEQTNPDDNIKFALWGGDAVEITDAQFEEVKRFAAFIRERDKKNGHT